MSHLETSNADSAQSKDAWNENLELLMSSTVCLLSADCLLGQILFRAAGHLENFPSCFPLLDVNVCTKQKLRLIVKPTLWGTSPSSIHGAPTQRLHNRAVAVRCILRRWPRKYVTRALHVHRRPRRATRTNVARALLLATSSSPIFTCVSQDQRYQESWS